MSGHYFDAEPAVASRPTTVALVLPQLSVDLAVDRGVFASDGVDAGTKYLLLDGPPPPATGALLDLGCGYGPIAMTLATRSPDAEVWAIDVNRRARELCAANAARLGLANVRVVSPDEVPAEVSFAAVYSNPPIRIGKDALHALLLTWLARIDPEGFAVLVTSKHLGADSLARWLATQGWSVHRLGSRQSYRLLRLDPAPAP